MLPSLRSSLLSSYSAAASSIICSSSSRSISYRGKSHPYPNPMKESKLHGNKEFVDYNIERQFPQIDFGGLRMFNKRHTRTHKKLLFKKFENRDSRYDHIYEHKYGCRGTGIRHAAYWEHVEEKVPELVVPDLTDCQLKPYVSYRTKVINQVCMLYIFQKYSIIVVDNQIVLASEYTDWPYKFRDRERL